MLLDCVLSHNGGEVKTGSQGDGSSLQEGAGSCAAHPSVHVWCCRNACSMLGLVVQAPRSVMSQALSFRLKGELSGRPASYTFSTHIQGRCSSTVCRYVRVYCVLEMWPIVVHVLFSTPVWRREAGGTCQSATSCVVSFDCFQKTPPTGQWRYTAAWLTRQGMGMEVPHHTGTGGGGALLTTLVGEEHSSLHWWGRGTPHYTGGGGARVHAHTLLHSSTLGWSLLRSLLPLSHCSGIPTLTHFLHFGYLTRSAKEESRSVS